MLVACGSINETSTLNIYRKKRPVCNDTNQNVFIEVSGNRDNFENNYANFSTRHETLNTQQICPTALYAFVLSRSATFTAAGFLQKASLRDLRSKYLSKCRTI